MQSNYFLLPKLISADFFLAGTKATFIGNYVLLLSQQQQQIIRAMGRFASCMTVLFSEDLVEERSREAEAAE